MPVKLDQLKEMQRDFYMARWVDGQLEMSPHCACGFELDEDMYCPECQRKCTMGFFVCDGIETLAVVKKFIHGNPQFKEFGSAVLEK